MFKKIKENRKFKAYLKRDALRRGITIKEVKKIRKYEDLFFSATYCWHVEEYLNGFTGVGVLKTPAIHNGKENTIAILSLGQNYKCNNIVVGTNAALTLDEAKDFAKVLNNCIEEFETTEKRGTKENES